MEKTKYLVTETTTVDVAAEAGMLVFTSTIEGGSTNNPKWVDELTPEMLDNAITIVVTDASSFELTMGVEGGSGFSAKPGGS